MPANNVYLICFDIFVLEVSLQVRRIQLAEIKALN